MLITADGFTAILQTLGLTQGLFKPIPDVTSFAQNTLGNAVDTMNGNSSNVGLSLNSGPFASIGNASQDQPAEQTDPLAETENSNNAECNVELYDAPPLGDQTFPPFDQTKANVYRYRQQQSVNLGSWFVHEQWMTPSVFACASGKMQSELDIASGWGSTENARTVLERHWDTFINQSDFEYLASIGINTVRIPIGFWSLGSSFCSDTPYAAVADVYQNSWPRVARAINMAGQAGLGVLIDLHGAPGSQNGQPHSGMSDGQTNLFYYQNNIDNTIATLTFLTQQLVPVTNVIGIQILNEPSNVPELIPFYEKAIMAMRQVSPAAARFPLYIHDGFDLDKFTDYVANRTDFVVQDHHSYFVFTPSDEAEPASRHTADVKSSVATSLSAASARERRNLVVDEWSCALTPESLSNESDPDESRRQFCSGQMEMYTNTTAGWSFWSYKKEDCDDGPGWCFKAAVGNSLPSSFFSYGEGPLTDPSQLPALADLVSDLTLPSASAILEIAQEADAETFNDTSASPTDYPSKRGTTERRRSSYHARLRASAVSSSGFRRQDIPDLVPNAQQAAITKGYSDGFLSAKIFALYGMSKLGFKEQYINDSLAMLGDTVVPSNMQGYYRDWFSKGLADGEAIVKAHVTSLI